MPGIENSKKVIKLAVEVGEVFQKVTEHKGDTLKDVQAVLSLADDVGLIGKISLKELRDEILDLDSDETKQLIDIIRKDYGVSSQYAKHIKERVLNLIESALKFASEVKGIVEDVKAGQKLWKEQQAKISEESKSEKKLIEDQIKSLQSRLSEIGKKPSKSKKSE